MTIFDFIKKKEVEYQKPIELEDGWMWSMKNHLRRSFLYKHSQFEEENENRELRPFKNITRPILNIQYRTEGFDVKDIELYVDNPDIYYKSFVVKKYHEKWARENFIDTFIDDVVESYVDYGGVLARDTASSRPEVIDLRNLAFCDQRDILSNPFAIKHSFSPSKLREMKKWGDPKYGATIGIEDLIVLCKDEKEIAVYEVHGVLPGKWIGMEGDVQQIQIVSFYKKQNGEKQGITLFKHREPKLPFKFLKRDKIEGRALGFGGVEELFEPQIWANYSEIQIAEMLDAASKIIFKSTDKGIAARHPSGLKGLDNLEIIEITEGKDIGQLDTTPRNLVVFENAVKKWEEHARIMGAASEPLLGETPTSGTPFKLYEAQLMESKSMHRYRQGKIAVFMDEIYRDWILPHISREIANERTFLSELSSDELQKVVDSIVEKKVFEMRAEKVLAGEFVSEEETEAFRRQTREKLAKRGSKWFIRIFKDEFKNPLGIMTNIAGKQKNLALLTDKIVNVLRQFISTPQIRQDPEMVKLLNVILESSGLSPIIFGAAPVPLPPAASAGTQPLKELGEAVKEAQTEKLVR